MSNQFTGYMSQVTRDNVTNADLLNTIREYASDAYKADIPRIGKFTQINHASIPYANYEIHQNEFYDILINRIGKTVFKGLIYDMPLGVFRRESFSYGETVQELYINLPDEEQFDAKSTNSPFQHANTEIKTFYHDLNRESQYRRTLEENWTMKALTSDNAFDSMTNMLFSTMFSADAVDEMDLIKTVITNSLTPVNVAPTGAPPVYIQSPAQEIITSSPNWLEDFSEELRARSSLFTVPSRIRFENAAGVPSATKQSDQYMIVTAEYAAKFDTMLANAFNMDKVSVLAHKIVIDEFPTYTGAGQYNGATPICALISKDSLVLQDKKLKMTNIYNPRNDTINYFLTHHQHVYFSLLENAKIYYTT